MVIIVYILIFVLLLCLAVIVFLDTIEFFKPIGVSRFKKIPKKQAVSGKERKRKSR